MNFSFIALIEFENKRFQGRTTNAAMFDEQNSRLSVTCMNALYGPGATVSPSCPARSHSALLSVPASCLECTVLPFMSVINSLIPVASVRLCDIVNSI